MENQEELLRGHLELKRGAELVNFVCDRCLKPKKSKIQVIWTSSTPEFTRTICNGCYGTLLLEIRRISNTKKVKPSSMSLSKPEGTLKPRAIKHRERMLNWQRDKYGASSSLQSSIDTVRRPLTGTEYRQRGNAYMDRQQYEDALREYNRSIAIDRTSALAYSLRGKVYRLLGREELATKDFSTADEIRATSSRYSEQPKYNGIARDIDWEILPLGWWHDPIQRSRVESQFKSRQQAQLFIERLNYLETFKPVQAFKSRFDSRNSPYYAFVFQKCVVAENPLEGNALYVIRGLESWKSLLGLSKLVLRQRYGHRIERIVHRGDWKGKLKREII